MIADLTELDRYLNAVRIPLRLACRTQSGWPMSLSLWFQCQDGFLYCATQKSARVVSYLQNEHRCAFEVASDDPPYCGVRGQAVASIQADIGGAILEKLLERYLGGTDNPLARTLLDKMDTEVALILEPKQVYSWDFTSRMANIPAVNSSDKVCP